MTAAVISFEHVGVDYGAQRRALDDVSLQSQAGEFLAIVGPSGSGKTTLLRLINRLSDPTSGIVNVNGEDIRSRDPIALRRRIGYVFQGVGLFPHLTVAENITITPKLLGWDAARRAARAKELLALTRLDESYLTRFPDQLSGG
ncbi:MAG: ATP-binding cassette domain-containing protein, partial [Xanthobacteraceae bacterium]